MTAIALIPARGGSKRLPGKNIKPLNGVPLLAYTVRAAIDSDCFSKVLVSSDSTEILEVAARYGADCLRRPDVLATDTSPDIEWVKHALGIYENFRVKSFANGKRLYTYYTFSILRPTSPFRMPETIQRAFDLWKDAWSEGFPYREYFSSLRAVELTGVHPAKTWRIINNQLVPVLLQPSPPWHDQQYAALPEVYQQNASLEIAWTKTVEETGTISGDRILPFITRGYEGFDLNTQRDWMVAEQMVVDGVPLPDVS